MTAGQLLLVVTITALITFPAGILCHAYARPLWRWLQRRLPAWRLVHKGQRVRKPWINE